MTIIGLVVGVASAILLSYASRCFFETGQLSGCFFAGIGSTLCPSHADGTVVSSPELQIAINSPRHTWEDFQQHIADLEGHVSVLKERILESEKQIADLKQNTISRAALSRTVQEAFQRHSFGHLDLPDFALSSAGAQVIHELTTQATGLRIPFLSPKVHPPELALKPNKEIGSCWRINARHGQLGVFLATPIAVTHVTIEHPPKQMSPEIELAPQIIIVWGLVMEKEKNLAAEGITLPSDLAQALGSRKSPPIALSRDVYAPLAFFVYNISSPNPVQTFPVFEDAKALKIMTEIVVVEIMDNWGAGATCLYRVQIHGEKEG
ncbi:hypothetical protein CONPUDRAFT_77697 [Coniophora puteana RWD-64-598 SS2]|uniref:SUN domain-containing protein n=1 Tax=Coniophora puteana (strain RWD-64-598) TaxID=741705 RepID=A0A5M3M6A9_CONPW|nr:uncharacterized protein CONPUDRAFT_77697 [Coniophora puteana RWD-64-598 SS2]EIW74888.1 hypothetical protein CONPUDRAFT_77697 [Coniophora puteana RWD-64-598 SS2]